MRRFLTIKHLYLFIHLSNLYLMIVSAGGPMQHTNALQLVNNELEKMWKEPVTT
jgi:hypothetical protein